MVSAAAALAVLIPRPGLAASDKKQVALTISGGVSLGSYEAGVNWAFTHALHGEDTELVVVTGASAGNINTLLTAYSWCGVDPQGHTPEQSLFWKAWIPVDLEGLVPRGFDTDYATDEGLFNRGAFHTGLASLRNLETAPASRDCSLRLGITLSKRTPGRVLMKAGNKSLEIPAMRYVVPFEATAKKQHPLQFTAPTREQISGWRISELGPHLLPSAPGRDVSLSQSILGYVQAASAFPYAFGAMNLDYWVPGERGAESENSGYEKKRDVFLDGGVFDNVPVGLSLSLLTPTSASAPPERFIFYIDPDQRRNILRPPSATNEDSKPIPLAGFSSVLAFMDGAVNSARKHELQTVVRYAQKENEPELRLTSRTTNVFGEYYAAFGAFADKRFRSMDFYLGIFDGLVSKAEWHCERLSPDSQEHARCVIAQIDAMQGTLNLRVESPLAAYVVDRLLPFTYPEAKDRAAAPLPEHGVESLTPQEAKVMLDVLIGNEHPDFSALLTALSEAGDKADLEWNSPVIDDPGAYRAEYVNRMLMRALTIEQHNEKRGNIRPLALANLITRSVLPQRGCELDPSTIPDSLENYSTFGSNVGHLLPYYLGFEFMPSGEFGARAQWRPTVPFGSRLRLIVPVDAGWLGKTQGFRVGAGLGLKLVIAPSLGFSADASGGVGNWGHDVSAAFRDGLGQLKADGAVQGGLTLFESLHVGYTYYMGPRIHSVSLGLMDFNGITYWLTRTAAGL